MVTALFLEWHGLIKMGLQTEHPRRIGCSSSSCKHDVPTVRSIDGMKLKGL